MCYDEQNSALQGCWHNNKTHIENALRSCAIITAASLRPRKFGYFRQDNLQGELIYSSNFSAYTSSEIFSSYVYKMAATNFYTDYGYTSCYDNANMGYQNYQYNSWPASYANYYNDMQTQAYNAQSYAQTAEPQAVVNEAQNLTAPNAVVRSGKRSAAALDEEPRTKQENAPSTLRALLTNPAKKLKYTPEYFYNSTDKTKQPQTQTENTGNKSPVTPVNHIEDLLADADLPTPSTHTLSSPSRSDVDYVNIFSPQSSKVSLQTTYKHGDYSSPPPQAATSTPLSYAEGMSTPPLSPHDKNKNLSVKNEINHTILTAADYNWSMVNDNLSSDTKDSKRTRQTYTRFQTLELEKEFHINAYIPRRRRIDISHALGLHERQIKIWFQNRRMKAKKDKTLEMDPRTVTYNGLALDSSGPATSNASNMPYLPHTAHTAMPSHAYSAYMPSNTQSFPPVNAGYLYNQHFDTTATQPQHHHHQLQHMPATTQHYAQYSQAATYHQHHHQQQQQQQLQLEMPAGSSLMYP